MGSARVGLSETGASTTNFIIDEELVLIGFIYCTTVQKMINPLSCQTSKKQLTMVSLCDLCTKTGKFGIQNLVQIRGFNSCYAKNRNIALLEANTVWQTNPPSREKVNIYLLF